MLYTKNETKHTKSCQNIKHELQLSTPFRSNRVRVSSSGICFAACLEFYISCKKMELKRNTSSINDCANFGAISFGRSSFKLGCGVYVYVVTWILLGQNSEETVDESVQKPFTVRTVMPFLTSQSLLSFPWLIVFFVVPNNNYMHCFENCGNCW